MCSIRFQVRYLLLWVTLFSLLFSIPSFATEKTASGQVRPTIALVFAGGGAKGAAHAGVLKQLEAMNIPIDIVTGTSMGAYVGALYAMGMNAQEIEDTMTSVDWNLGYRDRVNRNEKRLREKAYDDTYQLQTDLGLDKKGIRVPKGVVQGQNMLQIIRKTSGNPSTFRDFDHLAVRYRAVATDVVNLKPVVLDKGNLVDAMMASMSVPGALPPYEYQDMLLVDGGVTNNMPVDVAKAMGADVVIAVDISTDYKTKEELETLISVADQLTNYMVRRSTQEQIEKLSDQDILLKPAVGKMETTDFFEMSRAFKLGEEATTAQASKLKKLALSNLDYQAYQLKKRNMYAKIQQKTSRKIAKVKVDNQTHYNDVLVENRLGIKPGESYTQEEIETKVRSLYSVDRFEKVTYSFVDGGRKGDILNIKVEEKSWGPNYLDFRFSLEDDFAGTSKYALGMSANFTDLSDNGTEVRTSLELGTDKLVGAELYTPLSADQTYFANTSLKYTNQMSRLAFADNLEDGFSSSLDDIDNAYDVEYVQYEGELALGYQPDLDQDIRTGFRYTYGETEVDNFAGGVDFNYRRYGFFARYRNDTLDSFSFPTNGYYVDLNYLYSNDEIDDDGVFDDGRTRNWVSEYSGTFLAAKNYLQHSISTQLEYGVVTGQDSTFPVTLYELGGFLNLSGIPRDSLAGRNKALASLVYRYRWFENDFGLFRSPVYLGASVEYAGVWNDPDDYYNSDAMHIGGSIFTGIDSPLGPIIFSYGRTENNYDSVYLLIGSPF